MATTIPVIFTPGIDPVIYLPTNGDAVQYTATLNVGLSGAVTLSPCYDKYGIDWRWSTLEINSLTGTGGLSSTRVPYPSSWATTQCTLCAGTTALDVPGTYPKKWRPEGALSADFFTSGLIPCSATAITWTLSTNNWTAPKTEINKLSATESFIFNLKLNENFLSYPNIDYNNDTNIILNAVVSADCVDTLVSPPTAYTEIINETFNILSVVSPNIQVYTPNRFALTGVNISFENLSTRLKYVTKLVVNYDDGQITTLTGSNIFNSFNTTYNILGFKTLKIDAFVNYRETPYTFEFKDIIQVLDIYDQVQPEKYLSITTPIAIPWTTQPKINTNEWVTEDNINICFKKFYDNLNYLKTRGEIYNDTYSDYFGYLGTPLPTNTNIITGCPILTWEDTDFFTSDVASYISTWRDFFSGATTLDTGRWVEDGCATWNLHTCDNSRNNPVCFGKYCLEWNWRARESTNSLNIIYWKDTETPTISGGTYTKRWRYEPCETTPAPFACNEGFWNVNIKGLDSNYQTSTFSPRQDRCLYYGIVSKNNELFVSQRSSIKVLASDHAATYKSLRYTLDDVLTFSDIKNISIDSDGKIFVIDNLLSQVGVYKYNTNSNTWKLFTNWGGFGSSASTNKFSSPNDIHVDQLNNVWVCDTGNSCIKHFSNSGTWIKTIKDDALVLTPPISIAVDSLQRLHVLTKSGVRIYEYTGEFVNEYTYFNFISQTPIRICSSYNREIMYIASSNQIVKYFRTGIFAGYIIESDPNITNIAGLYHDEFRNLLITTDDKIVKFADIMALQKQIGTLPPTYWALEDLYIHKEEYVQNWVYTRAFQRLWDNIEIFRNSLLYSDCRPYIPPIHGKDKMIIGQNEIVTSTVVNRVLGYLWDNFTSIVNYYNTKCSN